MVKEILTLNTTAKNLGLGVVSKQVCDAFGFKFSPGYGSGSVFDKISLGSTLVLGNHPGVIDALVLFGCLTFRKDVNAIGAEDTIKPMSLLFPNIGRKLIPIYTTPGIRAVDGLIATAERILKIKHSRAERIAITDNGFDRAATLLQQQEMVVFFPGRNLGGDTGVWQSGLARLMQKIVEKDVSAKIVFAHIDNIPKHASLEWFLPLMRRKLIVNFVISSTRTMSFKEKSRREIVGQLRREYGECFPEY
ncbi:hypothetical protein HY310_03260 [Candidatus Microgenomates bacterium]|nr:hypothetical protein [Candidatus Microgenomates bacterium]